MVKLMANTFFSHSINKFKLFSACCRGIRLLGMDWRCLVHEVGQMKIDSGGMWFSR